MGNVTFLGVQGSGKTVLTMALVNAFKAHEQAGWFLRPETRDAFSFFAQCPSVLNEETFPQQATTSQHLVWNVVKEGEALRKINVLDYADEIYRLAFLNAKNEANPQDFAKRVAANKGVIDELSEYLTESDHIFVLFNPLEGTDIANNTANLAAVWDLNACLDYLHRLPHKPQVTLLLTQADRYATQDDFSPTTYVQRHLPLVYCNFPKLDVCAVSVLKQGDAPLGLNAIIARCLAKTPVVQQILGKIREYRERFEALIAANLIDKTVFQNLFNCLKYLAVDADYWKETFPWFMDPEHHCGPQELMSVDDAFECLMLMRDLYEECYVNQAVVDATVVYNFLEMRTPKTPIEGELLEAVKAAAIRALRGDAEPSEPMVSKPMPSFAPQTSSLNMGAKPAAPAPSTPLMLKSRVMAPVVPEDPAEDEPETSPASSFTEPESVAEEALPEDPIPPTTPKLRTRPSFESPKLFTEEMRAQAEEGERATSRRTMIRSIVMVCALLVVAFSTLFIFIDFDNFSGEARQSQTFSSITEIGLACEVYRMRTGTFPATLADLTKPLEEKGPLLDEARLCDAWGKPFDYKIENKRYKIRSAGADGTMNTEDDITN